MLASRLWLRTAVTTLPMALLFGVISIGANITVEASGMVAAEQPADQLPSLPARTYVIDRYVISPGGNEGAFSERFLLSGTVAQTAVGTTRSTSFRLNHGFWRDFGGPTCCNHDGMRGDVNFDLNGPNIVDLTNLVAYLFGGGDPPVSCP
jgi:hypothetical protein